MNPDRINQYRAYLTWAIRAVALILISYGIFWCMNRILFGLLCGQSFFTTVFQTWMSIGEDSAIYIGIASLLLGGILGISSKRLSIWVIAIPTDACPGCGYPRPSNSQESKKPPAPSTYCSECGLQGFTPKP